LFASLLLAPPQADTLYAVDLYGVLSVPEAVVRAAIGLRAGDPVPSSLDAARTRLRALPGVAEVDISAVCCSENGRTMLYVGIRESGTPPITYRSPPTRVASLPGEIVAAGNRFEAALGEAVRRGATGEDHSKGYWLAQDSALRAVQQVFIQIATQRFDTLSTVLHNSSDASQRALATQIIAYGANRQNVLRELLYAAGDPSDGVRNNAVRALGVLADWVNQNPQSGIAIPAAPFIDFLNSVSWTDRNKGVLVLMHLTTSRDPALLAQLRTRGLQSLIEMARWKNAGHALGPFIMLARIAGTEDGEAFRAFQAGERERVITRAQAVRR
jgi:hypothetical protein